MSLPGALNNNISSPEAPKIRHRASRFVAYWIVSIRLSSGHYQISLYFQIRSFSLGGGSIRRVPKMNFKGRGLKYEYLPNGIEIQCRKLERKRYSASKTRAELRFLHFPCECFTVWRLEKWQNVKHSRGMMSEWSFRSGFESRMAFSLEFAPQTFDSTREVLDF